ncbi:MAG: citramalate synthase [Proteobacteria bacterium]|nr:citramalate synthase [Pseudomonadota bacterium]
MKALVYETTLRDGLQGEGMHLSVDDKLVVTELLDDLGVAYIEGGWPGSNPRDETYFARAVDLKLANARLVAFGSTRRAGVRCDDDPSIQALLKANTSHVTLVGKAWKFQTTHALGISPEENLELVQDSVNYIKTRSDEVIFDAEHFFDGFRDEPDYAISVLHAAIAGGADYLVLCDTNGGTLTRELLLAVEHVKAGIDIPLGIHTHNDAEMAVANTIVAVSAGVSMVQGTINGYGERCGNANLSSIIPALELKMGISCLPEGKLSMLTHVSHTLDEITNRRPLTSQPYVGRSAFAHKGGIHTNAVMKDARTYEHVNPDTIGNMHRFLVSDLSGRSSVCQKASELGIDLKPDDPATQHILDRLKNLENKGYQFEGADASFKLLMDEATGNRPTYFVLHDLDVHVDIVSDKNTSTPSFECQASARIKLEVGGVVAEARAEGDGPVHAIDRTLRKLIDKFYPSLKKVELLDYKVRVLSSTEGTASVVRVLIRSGDCNEVWGTVGVSYNIIEASWQAMVDGLEYQLIRDNVEPHL